jgi:hypothetical protein
MLSWVRMLFLGAKAAPAASRFLWLVGVASVGSVGLIVAEACSPSPTQLPPDEFTLPTYDGSTFTLTPDVGAQPTRVLVSSQFGPEVGVPVVFQDSSGAVIASDKTDTLGRVARDVASGSQVTVLAGSAAAPNAITFIGVQPGDLLVAFDPIQSSFDANIVSLPTLPPSLADGGISTYGWTAGFCSNLDYSGPPIDITINPLCMNPVGQFPLLVTAYDTNGFPAAYANSRGNVASNDGGLGSIELADATWATSLGKWTVDVVNIPKGTQNPNLIFSEIAGGIATPQQQGLDTSPGDGGSLPTTFTTHPAFSDFVQTEISWGTYTAFSVIATRSDTPAPDGNVTMDLSNVLPLITAGTSDFQKAPTRPTANWSFESGTGGSAGSLVQIAWAQSTDAGAVNSTWTFVVPPGVTSLQAPELPSTATQWIPAFIYSNYVSVYSADTTSGFSSTEFRELAPSLPFGTAYYYDQPFIPPLPANGTARLTLLIPFAD